MYALADEIIGVLKTIKKEDLVDVAPTIQLLQPTQVPATEAPPSEAPAPESAPQSPEMQSRPSS